MIYVAFDSDISLLSVSEKIHELTCFAYETYGDSVGIFQAANLVKRDQTSYTSDEDKSQVENMMSFMRKFDEIWLVGVDGVTAKFDEAFRMELRVSVYDNIPVVRHGISGKFLP